MHISRCGICAYSYAINRRGKDQAGMASSLMTVMGKRTQLHCALQLGTLKLRLNGRLRRARLLGSSE